MFFLFVLYLGPLVLGGIGSSESNKRSTCFVSYSKMGVDIKGCASKFTVGCSSTVAYGLVFAVLFLD